MKHGYYLLITLLCLGKFSFAQQGSPMVRGTVKNYTGEPIRGANVYFTGGEISTSTDENGYFELVSTYIIDEIEIKSLGSETMRISENLNEYLDIRMKEYVNRPQYTSWFVADSTDTRKHKVDSMMVASNWKMKSSWARFPIEMEKYLRLVMIYPKIGLENKIEGVVEVEFIVNKEGRAEKPVILKSLGADFDKEVIRMIEIMPKWLPAEQNGYKLDVKMMLPVEFKLKVY